MSGLSSLSALVLAPVTVWHLCVGCNQIWCQSVAPVWPLAPVYLPCTVEGNVPSHRLPCLLPRPLTLPLSCHPKPSLGRGHMVSSAPLPPLRPAPPRPSPWCTETNLSPPEPRCLTFLCSLHPAILPSSAPLGISMLLSSLWLHTGAVLVWTRDCVGKHKKKWKMKMLDYCRTILFYCANTYRSCTEIKILSSFTDPHFVTNWRNKLK